MALKDALVFPAKQSYQSTDRQEGYQLHWKQYSALRRKQIVDLPGQLPLLTRRYLHSS